ncbi:extracellular solute-binding protein [Tessaracoccus sp.]
MSYTISRRGLLSMSAVAAGGAALGLSACGSDTLDPATSGDAPGDAASITGQNVRVWFMEGSISDAAIAHLETTFAKENEGNTCKVEIQPWDGIVSKQQTSLASKSESPDLVETGNTQSSIFTSVGAFAPLDDIYEDLGGADLIQSFVDAGRWEDTMYAMPLYAGARGVFYRKDLFAAANITEPKTLDEFTEAVIALGKANPEGVSGFSGMYLAAVDSHAVESLMFSGGGDWAVQNGEKWEEKLTDPSTVDSLERVQRLFVEGTTYGLDSQASQKAFEKYFNEGKVGVLVATGNVGTKLDQAMWDADKIAVMPIPGKNEGEVGQTFAGGSNISMAANAKNPELAKQALRVIFSEEFQKLLGEDGWVPGNTKFSDAITGPFGEISAKIVENSKLSPNTPQWGVATSNNFVRDFLTTIAQGKDVSSTTADYGVQLTDILNSK